MMDRTASTKPTMPSYDALIVQSRGLLQVVEQSRCGQTVTNIGFKFTRCNSLPDARQDRPRECCVCHQHLRTCFHHTTSFLGGRFGQLLHRSVLHREMASGEMIPKILLQRW